MMATLMEQHVDDSSNDFAILPTADTFKDYAKSYFAGTVAAGISYLAMIRDGYVWSDHFENVSGGSSSTKRTPDYVFAGTGSGVALMESKGSRSASSSAFDRTIDDGYAGQVEPHLGHAVGGATATHGFCIGAYLRSTTKAELRIHYTAAPVAGATGSAGDPGTISSVQRHSYATAFRLAHSERLSQQLRSGDSGPDSTIPFFRFHWRKRNWLTSFELAYPIYPYYWQSYSLQYRFGLHSGSKLRMAFAVEETIGVAALNQFLGGGEPGGVPIELRSLILGEEVASGEGPAGAVFPDGLAILSVEKELERTEQVVWDRARGQIELVR